MTIESLCHNLNKFQDIDKDIAQIMGTDSALRLVSPEYQAEQMQDSMRHVSYPRVSALNFNSSNVTDITTSLTYTNLKRLLIEIKRDHLQLKTHYRVGYRDRTQAALYLDDQYLDTVGLTPRDINYIAEDIAQQLGYFINGSKNSTNKK